MNERMLRAAGASIHFRIGATVVVALVAGLLIDTTVARAQTAPLANAQASCSVLQGRTIDAKVIGEPSGGAIVTSAIYKQAKADAPNAKGDAIIQGTPDYCEVLVDINPVDPSAPAIKAQVNFPTIWNGKKLQFGGGGFNGVLITGVQPGRNAGPEIPLPLTQGYMTVGTDSGHQNAPGVHPAAFALNAEAFSNFAYAAYKKTNDVALALAEIHYGRRPVRNYYMGGSEGGREGIMIAQRYPADFDGIVSIDPVINLTGLWTFQNSFGGLQSAPGSWLGSRAQLVQDTIAQACDALDGIADKVVSNYNACTASVVTAALNAKRCNGEESEACFSEGQLNALRAMYNGYTFPFALTNGMTSYPGYVPGSEMVPNNFTRWVTGTAPPGADPDAPGMGGNYQYGSWYVRFAVTRDPHFNALAYDPAAFRARVVELSKMLDANTPDLAAFFNRGGKLILREDLADKGQSAMSGLHYWDAVVASMGRDKVDQFFAAYVATGLGHTSGGYDAGTLNTPSYGIPGRVDLLAPLENWVEKGIAPPAALTLVNRRPLPPYEVVASKPMCRYGSYPKFTGASPAKGSDAANYACVAQ
jgi:feruloyl esterase